MYVYIWTWVDLFISTFINRFILLKLTANYDNEFQHDMIHLIPSIHTLEFTCPNIIHDGIKQKTNNKIISIEIFFLSRAIAFTSMSKYICLVYV